MRCETEPRHSDVRLRLCRSQNAQPSALTPQRGVILPPPAVARSTQSASPINSIVCLK